MSDNGTGPVAGQDSEVSIFAYLEILWRHKYPIVALILVSVLGAYFTVSRTKPTYEATSLVQVGMTQLGPLSSVDFYREVLESHPVLSALEQKTSVKESVLAEGTKVEFVGTTGLLRLTIRGRSPRDAEALGDAWYSVFYAQALKLWEDGLGRQLAVYPSDWQVTSGRPSSGTTGFKVQESANLGQWTAEMATSGRLERLRENLEHGVVDDIMVVSAFHSSGVPLSRRRSMSLLVAGVMALFVGASIAFGFEGWRAYAFGQRAGESA